MKQVKRDGLTYLINEKEGKAEIIGHYEYRDNFIIPRSIKHESQEYVVLSILKNAFKKSTYTKSIEFASDSELQTIDEYAFESSSIESIFIPPHVKKICEGTFYDCKQLRRIDIPTNSELQTIEKDAFKYSPIENIFIPASVIDLKEGWCHCIKKLTKIDVDPKNSRYSYLDDKMIICKTSETSENYDQIVFARRDIKEIQIPSFIKIIRSYSFEFCDALQLIDIPTNSELHTIDEYAFKCSSWSSIKSIFIPPQVIKISKYAFFVCGIPRIDIPSNSELQTIDEYAFKWSAIESIFIPPHVKKICEGTFYDCKQLRRIDIPTNSELQTIGEYAFASSSIESIFIPHQVLDLSKYAFYDCTKLHLIEIGEKSRIKLYDIGSIFPEGAIVLISISFYEHF